MTATPQFEALAARVDALWSPAGGEGAVTLAPSRRRWTLVAAGGAVFVALALLLPDANLGTTLRWIVGLFFAAVTAVGLVGLMPGAGGLELRRDGFTVISMFRRRFIPWSRTTAFRTGHLRVSPTKYVTFDLAGPAADGAVARVAGVVAGAQGSLPDTYGLAPADLAALMNRARERALGQSPERR